MRRLAPRPTFSFLAAAPARAPTRAEPATLETGAFWFLGVLVHHPGLACHMRASYTPRTLERLEAELARMGTLEVKQLPTGLPMAGEVRERSAVTQSGYDYVWTRDAVLVSNGWLRSGQPEKAAKAVGALFRYYATPNQLGRMQRTVEGVSLDRPHIKFDGRTLRDFPQKWAHAQNDALGLMLWMGATLGKRGLWVPDAGGRKVLALLVAYLDTLDYATDKDAGHWEEMGHRQGRVLASSVHAVVMGLVALREWMRADPSLGAALDKALASSVSTAARERLGSFQDPSTLERLISRGRQTLAGLLPDESRGPGIYQRPADLALLEVLYLDLQAPPADRVLSPRMRDEMISRFLRDLRGSHGDRRYVGDGYWGGLKRHRGKPVDQALINHAELEDRLPLLEKGGEAQWTLGTPLLSAIYGLLYRETGEARYLKLETSELNRAVGMVTGPQSPLGEGTLPESYMQVGTDLADPQSPLVFTENPLPLNWSKANLALAVAGMKDSLTFEAKLRSGKILAKSARTPPSRSADQARS
jgi:hypothetical protein